MLIPIDDPRRSALEPYRAVRERDLVGRQGRFVAEGEVVLRVLLARSRFTVESVLVSEKRAAAARRPRRACCRGCAGLRRAAGGDERDRGLSRSIAACWRSAGAARRPARPSCCATLGPVATVLGLVGLANHDNVGGIFRNAAAFGADAVLLDETSCDPLYRKAIRVSVGAALIVPLRARRQRRRSRRRARRPPSSRSWR